MKSVNFFLPAILVCIALCGTAGARSIRADLSSGSPWTLQGSATFVDGLVVDPAGVTGATPLFEYTAEGITDLQGGGDTNIYTDASNNPSANPFLLTGNPLNFANGYMYNWGSSPTNPNEQVTVYTVTDPGPSALGTPGNVLCDDADASSPAGGGSSCGYVLKGSMITEIQVNYPEGACSLGGSLTLYAVTYVNNSVGNGTCDNTFVFKDGKLYGAVPNGWTVVPLPGTLLLLCSGLAGCLILSPKRNRRVDAPMGYF